MPHETRAFAIYIHFGCISDRRFKVCLHTELWQRVRFVDRSALSEAAPVLHVDPFREFNPATPFSEGFKVSNDGKLDLYNLKFYCHTIHVKVGTNNFYGSNQLDAQPWKVRTIPASGNITIYCPLESSIYSDDHGQTKYAKTQIGFRVRFQHLLHPWGTQTCFQFLGVPDYTDTLQWTYLNNDCPTDIKDYP